ncbi:uncharacterized protein [Henckelia pumila]|uniref:uncharacterized protein n=1 Tax=Henckelia pumila TaxID=405737 RepID=UPI003C6DED9A
MEPEKDKILSKFFTSEPLKKMIAQLLLSLSIFSFVISYYSLCSSSQSHIPKLPCLPAKYPFNLHYSSHAVNKNYIFLICNALLVFLSKTSRSLRSSSGFDLNDVLRKRVGDGLMMQQTYKTPKEDEEYSRISMESDEDHGFEADADGIHEKETPSFLLGEEEYESLDHRQEFAEEEAAMSTEELNKKFEEFIRKTKEEIMMNEARQLVVVK